MHAVFHAAGGALRYLLSLLLALLYYVRVVNFMVPVLAALAFTHLCLGELARLRRQA